MCDVDHCLSQSDADVKPINRSCKAVSYRRSMIIIICCSLFHFFALIMPAQVK